MVSNNSTSKMIFELGGITFPAPRSPYPKLEGINNSALSPKDKLLIPLLY